MDGLEARKAKLTTLLAEAPEDMPDILPVASNIYAQKIKRLTDALTDPNEQVEAAEALRGLIEKIVLTPGSTREDMHATLYGDLRTILEWVARQSLGKTPERKTPAALATGVLVSLVAGAGFTHCFALHRTIISSHAAFAA